MKIRYVLVIWFEEFEEQMKIHDFMKKTFLYSINPISKVGDLIILQLSL